MPSMSITHLSELKLYKRYSDVGKVHARLVQHGDQKFMEVQEKLTGSYSCPGCKLLLSLCPFDKEDGPGIMFTYLEPKDFHEQHKPVDVDK